MIAHYLFLDNAIRLREAKNKAMSLNTISISARLKIVIPAKTPAADMPAQNKNRPDKSHNPKIISNAEKLLSKNELGMAFLRKSGKNPIQELGSKYEANAA